MTLEKDQFEEMLYLMGDAMERMAAIEKKPNDFGTGDLLHRSEIHTVQCIGDYPDETVTAIAERMKVTKGAISQIVRKLEDKKLVQRYQTPDNARDVRLKLTSRGETARKGHEKVHAKMRSHIKKYFGADFEKKLRKFREVFKDLNAILDEAETVKLHE